MTRLSRREFVAIAATGAAITTFDTDRHRYAAGLSAQDVVDRIKQRVGIEWKSETVDAFKAGDPAAAIIGVVTTAMAT